VSLGAGSSVTVYVVDVDRTAVGVASGWDADATAADIAELDAIVESLRFEP